MDLTEVWCEGVDWIHIWLKIGTNGTLL